MAAIPQQTKEQQIIGNIIEEWTARLRGLAAELAGQGVDTHWSVSVSTEGGEERTVSAWLTLLEAEGEDSGASEGTNEAYQVGN